MNAATEVDWHAAYEREAAKFQAETRTTSFLAALLRGQNVQCERCTQPGRVVVVHGQVRAWVCDICVARTAEFAERLERRVREDETILTRIAEGPSDGAIR